MPRLLRLSFLFTILLILGACTKNEVTLSFSLPKTLSSNVRVVYYASDKRGGTYIESVATVIDGKSELRTPFSNPALLYLYAGGNNPIIVYAERGEKLRISGTDNNPNLWTVEGNEINEELSLWRNAHATTLYSGSPSEVNEAVVDFVTGNEDNPISAILLLTYFSRKTDETQFVDLWFLLGEKADKEKWLKMVNRSDMPHSNVRHPGILTSMALRSLANGVDTIRPSAVDATIMLFWNNGMEQRREFIDSLKQLAKEFPDSASRMIADICVDADSISWRSPLRNDSVKNISRFWVPAGLADRHLMNLQISRTPLYVVVARNGRQIYRGDNHTAALNAFRKLAAASDTTTSR